MRIELSLGDDTVVLGFIRRHGCGDVRFRGAERCYCDPEKAMLVIAYYQLMKIVGKAWMPEVDEEERGRDASRGRRVTTKLGKVRPQVQARKLMTSFSAK